MRIAQEIDHRHWDRICSVVDLAVLTNRSILAVIAALKIFGYMCRDGTEIGSIRT